MIATGTRVALTVVTIFAWFAAGQRITTIQLDGTQYYISRMNPYSAELNYFLAYEYCRSIGLQLASFETLEKTNSISDFLRNAGYNKFDYWTSGNRLGTDMLIWMSTGLPFNTTFSQMKRPSTDNNGLDNEENLKMNARPELPIARKKRGESGSRDGCVAIKAPNMDWVTADCTDLKDFICEQTRCYYYNYGSIPVSSSQGFAYKQYKPSAASIYSTASAITSEENTTTPAAPVITTTTFIASPTVITATSSSTSTTTLSTEGYEEPVIKDDTKPNGPVPETDKTAATTVDPNTAAEDLTTEQQNYQEESQTVDEQQPTNEPDVQYYTTELPTLIQMHNQQQQQEQQQHDRYRQREHHQQQPDANNQKREDRPQQEQQNDNNAFAFESLEKAFATAVPHKIRSTKDLEQPKGTVDGVEQLPWSWAKDIMLQKPVLKKSSQEVA